MRTRDRKGLARLVEGSIAAKVDVGAPSKVRVFKPQSLLTLAHNQFTPTLKFVLM